MLYFSTIDACRKMQCSYRQHCATHYNETTKISSVNCTCPKYYKSSRSRLQICQPKVSELVNLFVN